MKIVHSSHCDECGKPCLSGEYVAFLNDHLGDDQTDDDAHIVCKDCLKKALEMLK
jgi:hypothetical protein